MLMIEERGGRQQNGVGGRGWVGANTNRESERRVVAVPVVWAVGPAAICRERVAAAHPRSCAERQVLYRLPAQHVKCTSAVPQGQLTLAYVVSRCICLVTLHVLVCRSFGGDPFGVELRGRFVWGAAS